MTAEQRNKPVIIKNKNKQKLSPVEKELLEFYEKDQPVLLYGNDGLDLEKLVKRIERVYYAHNSDIGTEELIKAFENLFPLRYIDCGDMNGKEVYEALVGRSEFSSLEGGYLFKEYQHGDLIIDNLHCRLNNDEDDKYYRKLGKIIKERQIGHLPTNFNWLVAYTHDPEPFPTYFKNQFELCLLDGELKESIKISRINALKHIGKEPKTEVEQQEEKAEKSLPKEELEGRYLFHERDDFYIIQYEYENFMLKATDGLKYIHYLLKHPYDPAHPKKSLNKFIARNLFKETHKLPKADEDAIDALWDIYETAQEGGDHGGFTFKGRGDYTDEIAGDTKKEITRLLEEKELAKSAGNKEKEDHIQEDIDELKREY